MLAIAIASTHYRPQGNMTDNNADSPGPTMMEELEVFYDPQSVDENNCHVTPAKSTNEVTGPSTPPTVESAASADADQTAASEDLPALAPRRLDADLAVGGGADESTSERAAAAAAVDASEIDLLIQQLDEVEADFSAKLQSAEITIREKDAIIGALGHNIRELKEDNGRLRLDLQLQKDVVELTRTELDKTNGRLLEAREEIAQQASEYDKLLEQEVHRLEVRAKRVEKEVVSQAEGQFAQAKQLYDAVLAQRDELKMERNDLHKQLQVSKDQAKRRETKAKTTEADLLATIAGLKAEVAASEARAMSLQRERKVASEEAEDRIRVLEEALEQSDKERMSMKEEWMLARTNEERLVKENAELNIMCEELMSIVEGGNGEK